MTLSDLAFHRLFLSERISLAWHVVCVEDEVAHLEEAEEDSVAGAAGAAVATTAAEEATGHHEAAIAAGIGAEDGVIPHIERLGECGCIGQEANHAHQARSSVRLQE